MRAREAHSKEEVSHWSGELPKEFKHINLGSGAKNEYNMQRRKSMQESQTEEEEMQQQERMKTMSDMTRMIRAKKQNGREQQLVGE